MITNADNHSGFWVMVTGLITGVGTLFLFLTALIQLNSLSKTSKAEFIHKFKNDFFNDKTNRIFTAIDEGRIKFVNSRVPHFKIHRQESTINTHVIDNLLLGHLEDLGVFEKKGVVDIDMIYELFDYYIEVCWENEEIKNYINYQGDGDIYENFFYIYEKCKSLGIAKKFGVPILAWKIFWSLKRNLLKFC